MALSTEEITTAEQIYDFVRLHARNLHQTLWVNCITLPLLLAGAYVLIKMGHIAVGYYMLGVAVGFAFALILVIAARQKSYKEDSVLLHMLERDHPHELPWVEVEKQLAALKELEQELANEHATP